MLNPFPIQFLALLAYFILRSLVALCLLRVAHKHLRELSYFPKESHPYTHTTLYVLIASESTIGLLLVIGLYTQYTTLGILVLAMMYRHLRNKLPHIPDSIATTLLVACALSLFITGAGAFAFDLPI